MLERVDVPALVRKLTFEFADAAQHSGRRLTIIEQQRVRDALNLHFEFRDALARARQLRVYRCYTRVAFE